MCINLFDVSMQSSVSVYISHVFDDQEKCIDLKVCNVKVSLYLVK